MLMVCPHHGHYHYYAVVLIGRTARLVCTSVCLSDRLSRTGSYIENRKTKRLRTTKIGAGVL